jgi:hypothetical protein
MPCESFITSAASAETQSGYALSVAGHRTKWDEDNPSVVNPAAIAATVALILFFVGLAVLFALT